MIIMKEKMRNNNLNFLKDVSTMYRNFIILVITFSEKKIGGVIFVPPLVMWRMTAAN